MRYLTKYYAHDVTTDSSSFVSRFQYTLMYLYHCCDCFPSKIVIILSLIHHRKFVHYKLTTLYHMYRKRKLVLIGAGIVKNLEKSYEKLG